MAKSADWNKLILRYADGRQICNCGDAYYSPCGVGLVAGVWRNDIPTCADGCSANQISAKQEIATKVLKELDGQEAD